MSCPVQSVKYDFAITHTGGGTTTYSDVLVGLDGRYLEWIEAFVIMTLTGSPTTPSLTLTIQSTMDGGTTWRDLVAFTALTATGSESKECHRTHGTAGQRFLGRQFRIKRLYSTDSGAATFTGSIYINGA